MTKYDPQIHHRRSIRLQGYDYTQPGAYFVTVITRQRTCLFGEVVNGEMKLSDLGQIADECWRAIPDHFPFVELGVHVVMPNHVHGIIMIDWDGAQSNLGTIDDGKGAAMLRPNDNPHKINDKPGSLGAIVRSYKSAVSYQINKQFNLSQIWQRNYHEHIIRDADEANRIHLYIEANPAHWDEDDENPLVQRE